MEINDPRSTTEGQSSAPEHAGQSHVEEKRTFWGRARKVAILLLLFLLIFFFAAGLFIQLPIFKRLVVNELISTIESSTNGTLTVGEIKGNILEGFVMEDVTLRLKTGTRYDSIPLVHVNKILANYSLWRWIKTNEIGITSMTLEHPVVRFVKFQGDTTWNYSLLTKPVPAAPKGPPKPFTQIVDLSRMVIQNGAFYMRDYNFTPKQESDLKAKTANPALPAIDWTDAEVEEIDLDSRFYAKGDAVQSARVHHLSFIEKKSGFYVSHLQFSGYLDSLQGKIEDAKITTGHSAIGFAVEVARPKAVDLGHLSTTQHTDVTVSLKGPVISTAELKQFLPRPLDFLGGSPGVDLEASGEFGKLKVTRLDLDLKREGNISIAGELDNLHHPDSLAMNVALRGNNLSNGSLNEYVPGLHLPNLKRFGTITIPSLTYTGTPLNFHTKFAAKTTGAGDASGDVKLDLRNHRIQYQAGVKTTSFNVAALVPGDNYESSISVKVRLAGHGTNWRTMSSTITAKTDGPSSFGDYKVNTLDLAGAIDRGTFTTDHLDADVDGGPTVHVKSAMVGLSSASLPFRFNGTVDNLLLGDVIASQELNPARIDLQADIAGSAKSFEDVTGTARVRLFDLEYNGHALPEDTASISILPSDPNNSSLIVRSDLADLEVQKRFRLGDLIHVVPEHINALVSAIAHRDFVEPEPIRFATPLCTDSLDFDYHIRIKDLRPLADFLPRTFLLGQGTITGNVNGCRNGNISLISNGDSISFILRERTAIDTDLIESIVSETDSSGLSKDSLRSGITWIHSHRRDSAALALPKFEGTVPRLQAMPTSFHLALNNLSNDSERVLERLDALIDLHTDTVLRLGSALLYSPEVSMTYRNAALHFNISTLYNDELGIHLLGNAHFPNGNLDFSLDSAAVIYANPYFSPDNDELRQYVWRNDGPVQVELARNGTVRIDTFNVVHPISQRTKNPTLQRMSLGGTISGDTLHGWARFPSFNLQDLRRILPFNPNAKTFDFANYNGKVRDLEASINGTLERPEMAAHLFVDSMSYGSAGDTHITFDSNYVELSYKDNNLKGAMHIHVDTVTASAPNGLVSKSGERSELVATIQSIPMVLAFKEGPDYARDSAFAATAPVSASIRATDFPLDVATPFLPPFRQILGTGDFNFTISGSKDNVQYAGQAYIKNGALLVSETNMWYLFGGPITFAHNALVFQNDTIRNIPSDDPNGLANLNGSFTFKGFSISNFDLRLRSDRIMVLSDAAKETLPMAYGPVTISTGGQDFHFRNTFEAPWIDGVIDILSANVTMPSSSNEAQAVSGQGVIYETLPAAATAPASDTVYPRGEIQFDGVASTLPTSPDDTLFPNAMKDIFRNDNGTRSDTGSDEDQTTQTTSNPLAPSFTDKLRMDLAINTKGSATITIPFGGAAFGGLLGTELKAELKPGGTLEIKRNDDLQPATANGGFELSSKSTFTFLQTFDITGGRVGFTGDFTNPNLEDITAEYVGDHHSSLGGTDKAKVKIEINGTKNHPDIAIYNYEQKNGTDFEIRAEASPSAAQEDAIYFLGTGSFKSDLAGNNTSVATLLQSASGQLLGNILTDIAGSTTREVALRSASIDLKTGNAQVTAAYKDISLKLASGYSNIGTGNSPSGTYSFGFQTDVPLSMFMSQSWARPMIVEIQVNPNPSVSAPGTVSQQPQYLGKFIYNWTP